MTRRPRKVRKQKKKADSRKAHGPTKRRTCLIISPFTDWQDEYYDVIFRPAITEAGLEPIRADDLYKTGSIINDIWDLTKGATILLADLSGKNANVFYELGLAHAIARPVVLITDNINDVPFDLRSLRVISYDKNVSNWGSQLRASITTAIRETLAHPDTSILATFLHTQPRSASKALPADKKAILELRQEIEGLRRQVSDQSGKPSHISSPLEARELLQTYLRAGLSRDYAIEQIIHGGVPPGYARRLASQIWKGNKKRR
jgi:hypothetical protein